LRTLYPMFHCILCICHGLRLSNLNKETTYLLTYNSKMKIRSELLETDNDDTEHYRQQ